jgi:DNA-binding transcriptional ArsR family regulator
MATALSSIDPAAVTAAEQRKLTPSNEKRMRALLDALCDPTRVKIIRALRDTPLAASDLARVVDRDRAATSQHLRVLRESGAVTWERTGNVVRYSVSSGVRGSVVEEAVSAFDRLQPSATLSGR